MTAYFPFLDTLVELIQQNEDGTWECRSFNTGKIMNIRENDLSDILPF